MDRLSYSRKIKNSICNHIPWNLWILEHFEKKIKFKYGIIILPKNLPFVDIVIVGSGASGGACAWKLSESGAKVVLLE